MTAHLRLSRQERILWIQYALVKSIPAPPNAADRTHDPRSRLIRLRNYDSKSAQVRARIEPIRFDDVCSGSHDRLGHLYCSRRDGPSCRKRRVALWGMGSSRSAHDSGCLRREFLPRLRRQVVRSVTVAGTEESPTQFSSLLPRDRRRVISCATTHSHRRRRGSRVGISTNALRQR